MNEKTILRGGHFQRNPYLTYISDEQKTSILKIGLITIFALLVLFLVIAPASADNWSDYVYTAFTAENITVNVNC